MSCYPADQVSKSGLGHLSVNHWPYYLGLRIATVCHDFIDTFSNRMVEDALRMRADVLTFPDRPWMGETIKLPHSDPITTLSPSPTGE